MTTFVKSSTRGYLRMLATQQDAEVEQAYQQSQQLEVGEVITLEESDVTGQLMNRLNCAAPERDDDDCVWFNWGTKRLDADTLHDVFEILHSTNWEIAIEDGYMWVVVFDL